ncbi:glycosyltransferase [Winogradskyella sp.]|uniref:glycosyltransferase n=1 Tax=Winogradskyella sp. TaxID=1883156 RepID=UPI003F6BEDC7
MISTIAIVIIIIYLILIGLLIYGFDKVDDFYLQDLKPESEFSIIIPFRNESKNLEPLLNSIASLNYPKQRFEVILVDDSSEDDSTSIIKSFIKKSENKKTPVNINLIQNERTTHSPKKDAITSAINIAKFSWIITTDADCSFNTYWLDTFNEFIITQNPDAIVAPVTYSNSYSFNTRFQTLDFLSLQGATIGGFGIKWPFMCNGANFAYKKEVFNSIDGFEGNTKIASGDDIFLLEKLVNTYAVMYLKSQKAIVQTQPVATINDLIEQRLRWASKTSHYNNWVAKLIGSIVLIGNLVCLVLIPLVIFNFISLKVSIALFVLKFSSDFLLLFKTVRFYQQESVLTSYIFSSIIYPFFNVYVVVLSLIRPYKWKGRTFKK